MYIVPRDEQSVATEARAREKFSKTDLYKTWLNKNLVTPTTSFFLDSRYIRIISRSCQDVCRLDRLLSQTLKSRLEILSVYRKTLPP